MATKVRTEHERGGSRPIRTQPNRFLGLFLSPFAGLAVAWLIHYWTGGIDLRWQDWAWTVHASAAAMPVAVTIFSWVTVGLAWVAWHFTEHRETPKRAALAGSVFAVGALFSVNVGTGPNWWWSGLFILGGWAVAITWSIARLDVARNDRREGEAEEREDGLLKKLGISKLTRFFPKVVHDEKTGKPVRLDVDVHHAPGETVSVLQDGLGSIESGAAGPPGLSTATGDPDRADRSYLSVLLSNPFRDHLPVGPLTAPGGSIADWASVADYADRRPAFVTIAGGKHMASSTSYGLIGMTRAGKTGTETQLLTEWGSRIDWVCLYLNQAKGLQDIRPLLPIIEAAVIAEDGDAGLGEYVVAFDQVKSIMIYRQQQLARFAVSAWSPRCADRDPARRPSRIVGGRREVMEPMPFFTCHVGEADAIYSSGKASAFGVYIASKGLSLGVNTGSSLQRPDWKAMPTELRANIGLWFVHGLNDTDEEEFVLDQEVRTAGASPGRWGQRKPGQHYMTGPGIDEQRFPIALKTRFLVGEPTDENGTPIDFDTLNDRYMAEMLRRNLDSAPRMAKLDRGSAEATDGWWDEQVRKTDELRARMFSDGPATSAPANPQTAPRKSRPFGPQGAPATSPADADDDEMDPEEMREAMEEFDDDAAETTEVEGQPLYDDDPREAAAARSVDLTRPARVADLDVDPLADAEEDDKPEARTREEARTEVRRVLVEMLDDPQYADRKVPGTALVTVPQVMERFHLRSRPWVVAEFGEMLMTGGGVEDGVVLERHGDPRKGGYRLRRTSGADHGKSPDTP